MVRYVLKYLWNGRKSFRGVFVEQMLISAVMAICFVSLYDMLEKYSSPGLLDTDNVALLSCVQRPYARSGIERMEVNRALDMVVENVRQWDFVEYATETSSFVPYLRDPEQYGGDSVAVEGRGKYYVHVKIADEYTQGALGVNIVEGTWLRPLRDGSTPALISMQMVEEMGMDKESSVGLRLTTGLGRLCTVVGVYDGVKEDPFTQASSSIIVPCAFKDSVRPYREICFKLEPGHMQEFRNRLHKECRRIVPHLNTVDIGIHDMKYFKAEAMSRVTSRLKLILIPTVLLILFAFVGTLGLLSLNAKKRAVEYSLHRAVGATRTSLLRLVILQSVIMTLMASLPGVVLAAVASSFSQAGLYSVLSTVALMLLFSLVSACQPAWKTAGINPATVLHEE